MYFSLFKFVDSGLFTANLVSSLYCYWIISDCKQVEMLYKQGWETWNCSCVWVAIFKVASKWSVHWGGKWEQIFTSLKVLFSSDTFGQAMCGVSLCWVALEALLAMVCPRVSKKPPWTCVVACVWQRAACASLCFVLVLETLEEGEVVSSLHNGWAYKKARHLPN